MQHPARRGISKVHYSGTDGHKVNGDGVAKVVVLEAAPNRYQSHGVTLPLAGGMDESKLALKYELESRCISSFSSSLLGLLLSFTIRQHVLQTSPACPELGLGHIDPTDSSGPWNLRSSY